MERGGMEHGGRAPNRDPSLHSAPPVRKKMSVWTAPPASLQAPSPGDTGAGQGHWRTVPAVPGEAVGQASLGPKPQPPTSPTDSCPGPHCPGAGQEV